MTKAKRPTIPEAIDRLTDDMFDVLVSHPPADRLQGRLNVAEAIQVLTGVLRQILEVLMLTSKRFGDMARMSPMYEDVKPPPPNERCRLIAPETVSWPQPGRVRPGLHPEKNKTMLYVVLKPFVDQGRDYRPGDTIELSPVLAVLGMHGPVEDHLLAPIAEARSLAIAAAERRRKADAEERLAAEADARAYGLRHKLVM